MIPQRNLSRLSNRLASGGGQRISEAVLERDYCLAWLLVGLAGSPLRNRLAFKGGTALKRCYFEDYRFSQDLDFTLVEELSFDTIRQELEPLFAWVQRATGIEFRYEREDRDGHHNSHTFYISYEGPLPRGVTRPQVKVDVTIREVLTFPLVDRAVLRSYDEFSDLPPAAAVRAYSLEEIAVEKVVAVTHPARHEPRDLYDLWYLLDGDHADLTGMTDAVARKLAFRGRDATRLGTELEAKHGRLKVLWRTRLAAQMVTLPEFEAVFRAVQRRFRQAGFRSR